MKTAALLAFAGAALLFVACGGDDDGNGGEDATPEGRLVVIEITEDGCSPLIVPVTEGERLIMEANNTTDVEVRLGGARIGPKGTRQFPTVMEDQPGRDYLTCEGPSGEVQEIVFEGLPQD